MLRLASVVTMLATILLQHGNANAALLTGSFDFAPSVDVSLDSLIVNTETDLVDIQMSGRADGWFGIGFGSNTMANTYGIIVHTSGLIEERRLNYSGGFVLDPELTIVSSNVVGNVRSIHVRRDRDLQMANYFTFPDTAGNIALIGADGAGNYGYHGGGRSAGSVTLSAVPEPGSTMFFLVGSAIVYLFRKRGIALSPFFSGVRSPYSMT